VKDIIRRSVRSVADLEALLLVAGQPEREWRAVDVSQALYVTGAAAEEQLERLKAQGILISPADGLYRYEPQDDKVRQQIAELSQVYDRWRVRVIEYIYTRPSDSVRSFAHAFRIKGDSKE